MESNVCPLLGLIDERGAYLTYPSYENRCYSSPSSQAIPLNEQTFFCLGGHRDRCPRFVAWQAQHESAGAPSAGEPAAAAKPESPFAPRREPAAAATTDDLPASETGSGEDWMPPSSSHAETFYLPAGGNNYADEEEDPLWAAPAYGPPPPADPWNYQTPGMYRGGGNRPVWPLLLAAGTLVVVLMLCAGASAAWLGVQTISSRLALAPSSTAIIESETRPVVVLTSTQFPDGIVVVTATPTPGEGVLVTQTLPPAAVETATPTWTPFPSPTPFPTSPPVSGATPTWTWTPRPTPTPRDTPTFFPTNTPGPAATPTWTWTPGPTNTPPRESYSVSFSASPSTINAGQEAVLSWTVRGVDQIYLDGDPVSGPSGSRRVKPLLTTTYVLRVIQYSGAVVEERQTVTVNVPTSTATPTHTPTFTPTPYYNFTFAENRTGTEENGTNTSCRSGDGCPLFSIQITNMGNRRSNYWVTKSQSLPTGWSAFVCWGGDCDFSSNPPARAVDIGQRQTMTVNFLLPSNISDGQVGTVTIRGNCENCANPVYERTFTLTINIPQPTPSATPTATNTPTPTPTPTATPVREFRLSIDPSSGEAITNGQGCVLPNGCTLFDAIVTNAGTIAETYRVQLDKNLPDGWAVIICVDSNCYVGDVISNLTLNSGQLDVFSVNLVLDGGPPTPGQSGSVRFQVDPNISYPNPPVRDLTIIYQP